MNIPAHPQSEANDPLYAAALSYLSNRHATLWSDFILPDNIIPAARWLSSQIQGVAEHYDAPFFTAGTAGTKPLTAPYSGPYSTKSTGGGQRPEKEKEKEKTGLAATVAAGRERHNGIPDELTGRNRPSALRTHGQQPERW